MSKFTKNAKVVMKSYRPLLRGTEPAQWCNCEFCQDTVMNPKRPLWQQAAFIGFIVSLCLIGSCAVSHAADYTNEQIANAIYKAEGGKRAKKPYGILSVKCEGEKECRQVCLNTIKNNRIRYKKHGQRKFGTYLAFLASRYCPVGAGNDPKGLNRHWLKNVTYFLERGV